MRAAQIADEQGTTKETAEAFFNALNYVGGQVEGDSSLGCIQVDEKEILDLWRVEDEGG